MALLPKSRKARRRLTAVAAAAPVLALAVGLSLYAMRDSVVFFYGPTQLQAEAPPPGQVIRVGGLVAPGTVTKAADGAVSFGIADGGAQVTAFYQGDLPDLFREGQGVVAQGRFDTEGRFRADEVLAKHDETYMPREVVEALKASGEWRAEGGPAPAARP